MNREDMIRKLTSRKFWIALCGVVTGLILIFGGSEGDAQKWAGVIMEAASVIAYMIGEGLSDAASVTLVGGTDEQ